MSLFLPDLINIVGVDAVVVESDTIIVGDEESGEMSWGMS